MRSEFLLFNNTRKRYPISIYGLKDHRKIMTLEFEDKNYSINVSLFKKLVNQTHSIVYNDNLESLYQKSAEKNGIIFSLYDPTIKIVK